MSEIYVSTDVESDGPIPGQNSMLSFASAAFSLDKKLITTFSANLELLPHAMPDSKTMDFWKTQPEAWKKNRETLQDPKTVMKNYVEWINLLPGEPIFVAYPMGFDFTFIYWYLLRFTGDSPFGHHGIDIRSYAMAILKLEYKKSGKDNMPKRWFDGLSHSHYALDDAIEQGFLFCNMLIENTREK